MGILNAGEKIPAYRYGRSGLEKRRIPIPAKPEAFKKYLEG
jgi:hypothetical protein